MRTDGVLQALLLAGLLSATGSSCSSGPTTWDPTVTPFASFKLIFDS